LQAIKQFVEVERPASYAICCRRNEFGALPTRLSIPGEIVLEPLSEKQIDNYLSGSKFLGLAPLRAESADLCKFERIPFMLNTIAVVTRGKSERQIRLEIKTLDNPARLRDEILEAYLNRRLKETISALYPNLRRTREQLRWLAQELIQHDETDFYIENLQPDWLNSPTYIKLYTRIIRLC
jgi:hypothetical protein